MTIPPKDTGAVEDVDPPIAFAHAFRVMLRAMSRPGAPVEFDPRHLTELAAPGPMSGAAAAVLVTLADADAPVWLGPSRRTPEIEGYLRFRCGATLLDDPQAAAFAYGTWRDVAEATLAIGSPEYPDRSTTVLLDVEDFENGPAARLSGPGLAEPARLAVGGVDREFWDWCARNAALFPLGVDTLLCAGDRIVGLPRSARPERMD